MQNLFMFCSAYKRSLACLHVVLTSSSTWRTAAWPCAASASFLAVRKCVKSVYEKERHREKEREKGVKREKGETERQRERKQRRKEKGKYIKRKEKKKTTKTYTHAIPESHSST